MTIQRVLTAHQRKDQELCARELSSYACYMFTDSKITTVNCIVASYYNDVVAWWKVQLFWRTPCHAPECYTGYISGAQCCDHISSILYSLHWLPICQRVTFKITRHVWKCVHGTATACPQELCVPVEDVWRRPWLLSASNQCIQLPKLR